MNIFIMDTYGAALAWAMRCIDDGHKVRWHVRPDPKFDLVGKGIIERVDDYRTAYKWADLIVFTDCGPWMKEVDRWREEGYPVIGAGVEGATWEQDREKGMSVFKKAGVKVADSKSFDSYDPAIAYVKREMRRFVSKPDASDDKALSYCSKSPADMVYMLERWKKNNKLDGTFLLQEFIPGVEMAVGGWFGPGGFNRGWNENFEFKKLMNDDLGVATGEQGTVMRNVAKSKLADMVLRPIEEHLERIGYVGYIDVNCIIDEEGTPWPLEFTMRMGWPHFNILQSLHKGDHAQWLMDLHEGKDTRNFEMDEVAVGVVLSIPDYPYSHLTRKEVNGVPLYGLTAKLAPSVYPCEMMMGEAPQEVGGKIVNLPCLTTAGDFVLVAAEAGTTVSDARVKVYRDLKKLTMPNSPMYRTDIGSRLKKQLPIIQAQGFADGLTY